MSVMRNPTVIWHFFSREPARTSTQTLYGQKLVVVVIWPACDTWDIVLQTCCRESQQVIVVVVVAVAIVIWPACDTWDTLLQTCCRESQRVCYKETQNACVNRRRSDWWGTWHDLHSSHQQTRPTAAATMHLNKNFSATKLQFGIVVMR